MKFTDGYWLTKDGYTINHPRELRDYKISENSVNLYAPYKKIITRGDTLNLGMTTVNIESPLKNVLKVKLTHHDVDVAGPNFGVVTDNKQMQVSDTESALTITTGDLSVRIPKDEAFQMEFIGKEDRVLTSSKPLAQAEIVSNEGKHYMREQLSMDPYEYIYGLGERFTPFVKNGQTVDIWNEDGGTGSEQAYKNIPFYLTNKGYGVFVNHPEKVSFEVGSENVSRTQFSVEGQHLEYYIIYGETANKTLELYTDLTGKPALPPAWSFGLWLSTSFTTDYSEKTVMKFIDEMQEREIPFDVFHFDCFWMKEFEWCGFEWDEELFPDPAGMIKRIHDKGLKVCVWINPYIGQKSPAYKECKDKGYFIKNKDGQVWQWDLWQAGQGIIDFTNPEACAWYKAKLDELIDIGVDSFKTDFGERIPTDAVYYDGSDPQKMHNYYAYQYNDVVFSHLEDRRGKNEAVLFARSASVGSQKFPVHWGGDNLSEYTSMAESLRGGLSFLLSGFGFWSHDIGGFEENASDDIYKRWTQFGLLSSHSRYHGNIEYRVPWNFGEEAALVTQKFSKLKNRLMPYLYKEAIHTAKTGIPLMKALFLEFEEDYTVHTIDKQYMFGKDLMVAPIFNENGVAQFYLPEGTWTDYLTNQVYTGGKWFEQQYDYFGLPFLARPNSIIIEGEVETTSVYDYGKNITVNVFEVDREVTETVYDSLGEEIGKITITPNGDSYDIDVQNLENVTVVFRNKTIPKMETSELGSILKL